MYNEITLKTIGKLDALYKRLQERLSNPVQLKAIGFENMCKSTAMQMLGVVDFAKELGADVNIIYRVYNDFTGIIKAMIDMNKKGGR